MLRFLFATVALLAVASQASAIQIAVSANLPEQWVWARLYTFGPCGDPVCPETQFGATAGKLPSVSVSGYVETDTLTAHLDTVTLGTSLWQFGALPDFGRVFDAGTWTRSYDIDPPGLEPPMSFTDGPFDYDLRFDSSVPEIVISATSAVSFLLTPTTTSAFGSTPISGTSVAINGTAFSQIVDGVVAAPSPVAPLGSGNGGVTATVVCDQGPPITCGLSLSRNPLPAVTAGIGTPFSSPFPPGAINKSTTIADPNELIGLMIVDVVVAPVPEPGALLLVGLALVAVVRARQWRVRPS